ncbi:MAG: C40 family peptidase [Cytophagales bacterium]|nr:C40 family peptidase [Cytophagales bacterium]
MFGLTLYNIIPVRTTPKNAEELCTQLLFGDTYEVIEEHEDWMKIRISFDAYEGWIDRKLHTPIEELVYEQYQKQPAHYVTETVSSLHGQTVVMGSQIPFFELNNYKGKHSQSEKYTVRDLALKYWNVPYLWGGKTNFGIDCSGFAQQVFKMLGYSLKRDAYQQAEQGIQIDFKEHTTGDLAFFENEKGRIIHVGIILEKGQIIHAHGKVRIDPLTHEGIWNGEEEYQSHKLSHIQKIL